MAFTQCSVNFFFVCHPLYSLKKSLEHGQLCVLGCFASSRITSRRYPNRDVFATLWFARYPLELWLDLNVAGVQHQEGLPRYMKLQGQNIKSVFHITLQNCSINSDQQPLPRYMKLQECNTKSNFYSCMKLQEFISLNINTVEPSIKQTPSATS